MVATRRKQPARKKVIEVDDGPEAGGGDQDEAFDIGNEPAADHVDDEFIEGVDDHEIPILKKKSKKVRAINNKVPIKRSRIAGRLSRVQELSIGKLLSLQSISCSDLLQRCSSRYAIVSRIVPSSHTSPFPLRLSLTLIRLT